MLLTMSAANATTTRGSRIRRTQIITGSAPPAIGEPIDDDALLARVPDGLTAERLVLVVVRGDAPARDVTFACAVVLADDVAGEGVIRVVRPVELGPECVSCDGDERRHDQRCHTVKPQMIHAAP